MKALSGTIKSFDPKYGYGFIGRPGFDDLFVHITQVRGVDRQLNKGDQVSFDIGPGRKGPEAKNVIVNLRAPQAALRTSDSGLRN